MELEIIRDQYMGKLQDFLSQIAPITEKSGNRHSKGSIHRGGIEYIRCTDNPARRAPQRY